MTWWLIIDTGVCALEPRSILLLEVFQDGHLGFCQCRQMGRIPLAGLNLYIPPVVTCQTWASEWDNMEHGWVKWTFLIPGYSLICLCSYSLMNQIKQHTNSKSLALFLILIWSLSQSKLGETRPLICFGLGFHLALHILLDKNTS